MKRLLKVLAGLALLIPLWAIATPVQAQNLVRPCQYFTTVPTLVNNQWGSLLCDRNSKLIVGVTPYAVGVQTPLIAGSGNVANAAAAATLTGTATTTVYITGFEMTATGATAALPVTCTVTGLLGGTRSYTFGYPAGVLVYGLPLIVEYAPPLPASAVNTAIVVSCPASGAGGTNATMVAHGFYQ